MELIQKIKDAESKAQQIIEQAKADAAKLAEKERKNRQMQLNQAQQQRKSVIDKAVEQATALAQEQAGELITQLSGQTYNDYVKAQILDPLGLELDPVVRELPERGPVHQEHQVQSRVDRRRRGASQSHD